MIKKDTLILVPDIVLLIIVIVGMVLNVSDYLAAGIAGGFAYSIFAAFIYTLSKTFGNKDTKTPTVKFIMWSFVVFLVIFIVLAMILGAIKK
ncbi:LasU family protein [Companilactobacillus ginsenosidimutans]|uniref:Uncharacterized protein n=1 Tax=Companilactobacillus ginsenosidimutans TaxID=1007676 RepID=A0A0H4QLW0_9LACO|nr:LasU family protein [Companilactobacillus ginsenosidimutans]AKP67688.1 hypothetical protein ABM34_09215 [Companilactobacillus ginsenosidimutans]